MVSVDAATAVWEDIADWAKVSAPLCPINRYVKDRAPPTPIAFWRARLLAFVGAALFGLVVPGGCIVVPEGGYPTRESIKDFFVGCDGPCRCGQCGPDEVSCGLPSDDCAAAEPDEPPYDTASSAVAACEPPCEEKPKLWHRLHLHRLHWYDPEAGIFNFCVPPQCLNPPPPLPPGRFFPVPVQPAFAQRADGGYGSGYNMVGGTGYSSGDCEHRPNSPCR